MRPTGTGNAASLEHAVAAASLRLHVNLLGWAALAGYSTLTLLSYVQAPALWRAENAPRMMAYFDDLAVLVPGIAVHHAFSSGEMVVASYWTPLALATTATLLLVVLLTRYATHPDATVLRLIFNWSLVFAAVCSLAFPVFTQDMWLSAVWGRMIASGLNPYYMLFAPEALEGLPLDHFPMVMSYGPLWGILSAVVAAAGGGKALAIGILSKALLAAAWIGGLVLVGRLTETRPMRDRCLAIAAFGWMPASVSQTLAEGHNDILLVVLALLWLFLMLRAHWAAPVALVASALCKYVTAPLLLVDALCAVRRERASWQSFLARQVAPALLGLGILAIFYRSTAFFDGLKVVSDWYFLRPSDGLIAIEKLTGVPVLPLKVAVVVFFPLLSAYWLAVAFWSPTADSLKKAAAAAMAAVLFSGVSHVWPWYVIWVLALTALVPGWWLSRFVFGAAAVMPFTLGAWWMEPVEQHVELAALAMYASASIWTALTRDRGYTRSSKKIVGSGSALPRTSSDYR